mgnify:CR=1 FL=1
MKTYIQINPQDNVCVALAPISAGTQINAGTTVTTLEDIPQGHKIALADIKEGEKVIKYGFPIGVAKQDIKAGSWVHVHNVKTGLGDVLDYEYNPSGSELEPTEHAHFMGYRREDGRVGVRNEIWIIPTVGCVNSIASALEKQAKSLAVGTVEDIVAFPHPYGCSQMGGDQENTRKALADLIHHPNAGGVLVLGLGCENSNIPVLMDYIGEYDKNRVKFLQCQDVEDEQAAAMELLKELADYAGTFKREPIDASELIIGMKCGGSDGLSGITANPTVGAFSDLLISKGGTTILTEVPEMFGAETILFDRAIDKDVFDRSVHLINDFKEYFIRYDQVIYENPSPGNKKGGITTLEEKSLGCVQKGGKSIVTDVLRYGDKSTKTGLNLLYGPGNDQVAVTVLAAAGAHMVLFTTGRGTPFGGTVPTLKISTNTDLYNKKKHWIDFNAGQILEDHDFESLDESFFKMIVDTASGEYVAHNEKNGYKEISILKDGVTL